MTQNNTPTSEERAREAVVKWLEPIRFTDSGEPASLVLRRQEKKDLIELITKALDAQRKEVARECVEICSNLPVDEKRCDVLLLTSQAWEEGQEQCAQTIKEKFDV